MISTVKKLAIGVEYDGKKYFGWQKQKEVKKTIQEELEKALSAVANHNIELTCAGRTDSGVHSIGQVAHFETFAKSRKEENWILGANSNLPIEITVHWIKRIPTQFHARFSAISRRYCYIIYNQKIRYSINYKNSMHIHQ